MIITKMVFELAFLFEHVLELKNYGLLLELWKGGSC